MEQEQVQKALAKGKDDHADKQLDAKEHDKKEKKHEKGDTKEEQKKEKHEKAEKTTKEEKKKKKKEKTEKKEKKEEKDKKEKKQKKEKKDNTDTQVQHKDSDDDQDLFSELFGSAPESPNEYGCNKIGKADFVWLECETMEKEETKAAEDAGSNATVSVGATAVASKKNGKKSGKKKRNGGNLKKGKQRRHGKSVKSAQPRGRGGKNKEGARLEQRRLKKEKVQAEEETPGTAQQQVQAGETKPDTEQQTVQAGETPLAGLVKTVIESLNRRSTLDRMGTAELKELSVVGCDSSGKKEKKTN